MEQHPRRGGLLLGVEMMGVIRAYIQVAISANLTSEPPLVLLNEIFSLHSRGRRRELARSPEFALAMGAPYGVALPQPAFPEMAAPLAPVLAHWTDSSGGGVARGRDQYGLRHRGHTTGILGPLGIHSC